MAGISINTGLKALLASQAALNTVGNNIANANTPGYSRQRVDLQQSLALGIRGLRIGTGVDALSVERSVDQVVMRRLLAQYSVGGRLGALLGGMGEVESLLEEPGGLGLGTKLDGLFSSFSALSAAPGDPILRMDAVQSSSALAGSFNQLSASLEAIQDDVPGQLEAYVDKVNFLAAGIDTLNGEIQKGEAAGGSANELLDQRDLLLDQLSELVDTTAIDQDNGRVQVLVAGGMLVGNSGVNELQLTTSPDGGPALQIDGATNLLDLKGGKIGGLMQFADGFVSTIQDDLDQLAKGLIFEVNKAHSTGVPASGPFHVLTSEYSLIDTDGDGDVGDELLADAGLPFDVQSGELYVTVTDEKTGELEKHSIAIDANGTSVQDLLDELSAIPHLSASLTGQNELRISADSGYGFDFSPQLDAKPDEIGAFGGGKASLGSGSAGPFALTHGDSLDLFHPASGAAVSITFDAADFENVNQATAEEVAAAINADPNAQAAGIEANVLGGHLFVQSQGAGAGESFDVVGGTALGALGWGGLAGTTVSGHDTEVTVEIGGKYNGDGNGVFTFVPSGDGTIGTTPGLAVDVFDETGAKVATLDVGPGYQPGAELAVADGVSVSFGLGELSQTHGDAFTLDVVADSDTSDALAALGLNSLFTGTDAGDIAVREDIADDPDLLATAWSSAEGDNSALLELLDLQDLGLASLDGGTLGSFYGELVSTVGFEVSAVQTGIQANDSLVASLQARRDQVSGVNVDEELVNMMQYEQAFGAALQFLTVVNQLNDELLGIL